MLTVFNVGQGDAFLLKPQCGCVFDEPAPLLLVDTGPPSSRLVSRLPTNNMIALLTHSHVDHIGGLPELIMANKLDGIFMPYYLPEITAIYRYVQNHVSVRLAQPDWNGLTPLIRQLLHEGDKLCGHITVLNPPASPFIYFTTGYGRSPNETGNIEQALKSLAELGMDLPVEEIVNYKTPIGEEGVAGIDQEYRANARTFVHQFFISLVHRASHSSSDGLSYYVDTHLQMTANQASVVFKYVHSNGTWLFTGDADEAVFDRLISEGTDLSASFLKVPHHGSRENTSCTTLNAVQPEFAVVSHKNRRFGRSLDTHPHHEVIDMLDQRGIRTYYTNPVIKDGMTIKSMATGTKEKGLITFIK